MIAKSSFAITAILSHRAIRLRPRTIHGPLRGLWTERDAETLARYNPISARARNGCTEVYCRFRAY
jgi:hypothetical protein